MEDCTCNLDGLCWYHQCSCTGWPPDPDCWYHNELRGVDVGSSMEYGDKTIRAT
jgi:hypothetical protein